MKHYMIQAGTLVQPFIQRLDKPDVNLYIKSEITNVNWIFTDEDMILGNSNSFYFVKLPKMISDIVGFAVAKEQVCLYDAP